MTDLELLKRDLLSELQRSEDLFNSQVLSNHSIFSQSAFIEILIRLNFILQELSKNGRRIGWIDDVNVSKSVKDITDLVNYLRNAACHSDSPRNIITKTQTRFVFNIFVGKCPNAVQIGQNQSIGNDFEDDIAFYYGDKRIYLIRHLKRLLEQLPSEINNLN